MTELTKLESRRNVLRKSLKQAIDLIQSELKAEMPDEDILLDQVAQIVAREKKLTSLNEAIIDLITDLDKMDEENEEVDTWTEEITLWKDRAKRLVERYERDRYEGRNGNGATGGTGISLPSLQTSSATTTVKLPQLQIKKFDGDHDLWFEFWGQYEGAIHNNCALSNSDKFNYLKSYLEGFAARSIKGITVSNENYEFAINTLKKRFGRKGMVLSERLNNFLELMSVQKSDDVRGLRHLHDSAQIEVRSLQSLGLLTTDSGELFAQMLGGLLPPEILEGFCREIEKKEKIEEKEVSIWNLEEMLDFLRVEIEIKERALSVTRRTVPIKSNNSAQQRDPNKDKLKFNSWSRPKSMPSAAVLNTAVKSYNRACPFCEGPHPYYSCDRLDVTEKKGIALKKKLCFLCLNMGHSAQYCRGRIQRCRKCGRSHHQILCVQNLDNNTEPKRAFQQESMPDNQEVASLHVAHPVAKGAPEILLQTAQAAIMGSNDEIGRARCLFDGGSHRCFVKEKMSRELNLEQIGEETLSIHPFGRDQPIVSVRRKVKIVLKNIQSNEQVEIQALETPEISGAALTVPGREIAQEMKSRGLQLADVQDKGGAKTVKTIDILIGADYFWKVAKATPILSLGEGLVAIDTKLGWTLQGPTNMSATAISANNIAVMKVSVSQLNADEHLTELVSSFWDLEHVGITAKSEIETPGENDVLKTFQETIEFRDGRYSVALPWKDNVNKLGNNFGEAKRRTLNLLSKLRARPSEFKAYNDIIEDQLNTGILEQVPFEQTENLTGPIYYLPHRGIVKKDRLTTKIRVVCDASSHIKGLPSLNECVESGPNLLPELFGILIRFRENKIAVSGDIEKAFHQIGVSESDRDALRFIWVKGINSPENENLVILRFARVPFGVTASPFLLTATIKNHVQKFREEFPNTSKILLEDLYVDDLISGEDNVQRAEALIQESTKIMAEGGFNLRKWRSNSKYLRDKWGGLTTNEQSLPSSGPLKVLGLMWDEERDVLLFDVQPLLDFLLSKKNTKRWVLKAVARIFDPLGLLSAFTVVAKIVFQDIWQQTNNREKNNKIDWDEQLPENISCRFEDWCEQLPTLNKIEIPRHYFKNESNKKLKSMELHGFVDASLRAYACVFYLKNVYENNLIETVLVASKTRVAPIGLKTLTLPRLELMSALLGARLGKTLLETLTVKPEKMVMWGDSTITLNWIYGHADRWKPFVKNRVLEIQKLTDKECWNHCPGIKNPADIASRGITLAKLENNELWWQGPKFLRQSEPIEQNFTPSEETVLEIENELRATPINIAANLNLVEQREQLFELENYNDLKPVLRVTAWIRRFTHNAKKKSKNTRGSLTTSELEEAEQFWIKRAQEESYLEEKEHLLAGKIIKRSSKILTLTPLLDDNEIIRVGGRIDAAKMSYQERHPCILPANHRLTYLMGVSIHLRLKHAGVNDVLVELRERFWVPKARQIIKKIVASCPRCKVYSAKATTAEMGPLPDIRINPSPPFEICGIDHAGPLYTRENKKCYVALYTCAVTRAVHLELVSSLSTESFLMSFRRFIARRGIVRVIMSDNAATFKRADADLQILMEKMRNPEVLNYFGTLKITWKYIAERAPWWGGFWERLVRSVKGALRKVLGQAHLNYEEIETLLIEIEATINSRPLTFIYENPGEPCPLTPAHFLVGKRLTALPSQIYSTSELPPVEKRDLIKRLKYRQTLLDKFWTRWKTDYLLELRSAHHRISRGLKTKELRVDDVVLVEDAKYPRAMWKLAVVVELKKGRDGIVRSCLVRLPNGNKLRRPVQLLYNLEI